MPTPSQVLNRNRPDRPDWTTTATVTAAGVALEPGGTLTTATALDGRTHAVGTRVLVLITAHGNYILGALA